VSIRRQPARKHAYPSAAEPTLDDICAAFPDWRIWKGICGLWYAQQQQTGPPVRGEDLADLRDQIRGVSWRSQ
jgi:hypothetical protein